MSSVLKRRGKATSGAREREGRSRTRRTREERGRGERLQQSNFSPTFLARSIFFSENRPFNIHMRSFGSKTFHYGSATGYSKECVFLKHARILAMKTFFVCSVLFLFFFFCTALNCLVFNRLSLKKQGGSFSEFILRVIMRLRATRWRREHCHLAGS